MPFLEVENLHKAYGDRQVLRGLEFDLEVGNSLVILGRSGTGKSVTLRQINGLERPDEGDVIFDGVSIPSLDERQLVPVRRRMSMLFQSGALFDSMDVFENIAFPLREHTDLDDDAIAEVVHRKLDKVGLAGIGDHLPSALSGGMRKRVAFARSLALDPEVVLYDEPTTGLDPVTSASIGRLMRQTQEEATMTSVVVTHDLPLAREVGDRIAFLEDGRFRFLGTWEEADASDDPVLSGFLQGRPAEDDGGTDQERRTTTRHDGEESSRT